MIHEASSKDVQKGLYTAWSTIFALPKPSKTPYAQRRSTTSVLSERAANALRLSSGGVGNLDRLIEGLFEFFLSIRYKDTGMHKTVGAFEWMQMIDILQNMGRQSQVRAPFVGQKVCLTCFLQKFHLDRSCRRLI